MERVKRKNETIFTARAMKITAIVIFAVDMLLLAVWFATGCYLSFGMIEYECFSHQTIPHFLILCHFPLSCYIVSMISKIETEEDYQEEYYGKKPVLLPYHIYDPFPWAIVSVVVLAGDIMLLVWASIEKDTHSSDECDAARSLHIALDVWALLVSLASIIWFIVFSIYTIRQKTPSTQ